MSEQMKTVRLRNGSAEIGKLVPITMLSLQSLMRDKPMVFYELVEVCKDRHHKPWGNLGHDLAEIGGVEQGSDGIIVHDSIRNIVLSAVTGEGLEMGLQNPIADGERIP